MKILNQTVMADGTLIRLEDWSEDFTFFPYGAMIAAYPKKYMRLRAEMEFKTHAEASAAFAKLTGGKADVTNFDFTVMKSGGNRVLLKPILEKYRREAIL